jgi:hypothetical protein
MNADAITPADKAVTPESLLENLRFLLRRYARTPSPSVAGKIADCVDGLLANRNFRVPPEERCTYRHMRTYWRLVESLG